MQFNVAAFPIYIWRTNFSLDLHWHLIVFVVSQLHRKIFVNNNITLLVFFLPMMLNFAHWSMSLWFF